MILKQKKNCKMIFCNDKYYIQTNKNLYHLGLDYEEAEKYYNNIAQIEEEGRLKPFENGKFKIELYPEDMELLLNSLETLSFFIKQNRFLDCNNETLIQKNFDIDFLAQYLFCLYNQYNPNKINTNKGKKGKNKIISKKEKIIKLN